MASRKVVMPYTVRYQDSINIQQMDGKWRAHSEAFGLNVYASTRPAAAKRLNTAVRALLLTLDGNGGIERVRALMQHAKVEYQIIPSGDDEVETELRTREIELGLPA